MDATTLFDRWAKDPSTKRDKVTSGEVIPYLIIFYNAECEEDILKLMKQHASHPDVISGMLYFAKNPYV